MGTRSLTRVHDVWNERDDILINMYRQFDGYPDGHGLEIAEFLEGKKVGNGISMNENMEKFFNGAGCLAAQLVANFKEVGSPGGFYLYPAEAGDCGQEYEYDIYVQPNDEIRIKVTGYRGSVLFNGNVDGFKAYCLDPQEDED